MTATPKDDQSHEARATGRNSDGTSLLATAPVPGMRGLYNCRNVDRVQIGENRGAGLRALAQVTHERALRHPNRGSESPRFDLNGDAEVMLTSPQTIS